MSIAVLYKRTHIVRLMISRFNWFTITCFSIATAMALTNPSFYYAIAILFLGFSSVVLLSDRSEKEYFNWQTEQGVRKTVILVSLIVMCLIVPQVETDLAKFSVSAIAQRES